MRREGERVSRWRLLSAPIGQENYRGRFWAMALPASGQKACKEGCSKKTIIPCKVLKIPLWGFCILPSLRRQENGRWQEEGEQARISLCCACSSLVTTGVKSPPRLLLLFGESTALHRDSIRTGGTRRGWQPTSLPSAHHRAQQPAQRMLLQRDGKGKSS